MANIHPIVTDFEHESERVVYERLARDLPDHIEVFFSVPYVEPTEKGARDGEIDFVILDPERGLLVLEVKGGKEIGYDRRGNGWYSVSRGGKTNDIKDPYRQAGRNMHALKREILHSGVLPGETSLPFTHGYGCVFPHTFFGGDGMPMHVRPDITIDMQGLQSIEEQIDTLFQTWGKKSSGDAVLADYMNGIIEEVLTPTFQTDRPLRARLDAESALFMELTDEQAAIYNGILKENPQALVRGHAGTGKTVLAERRATELAESGHDTLFLCYNRLLADHLKAKLSGIENLRVATFHEMADLLAKKSPWGEFPENPDQEFWEEGSAELLFDIVEAENIGYDAIIVDEAQDFRASWWLPVRAMLQEDSYFYVFYDPRQNVYDVDLAEIEDLPTSIPLTTNCRTTSAIRSFLGKLTDLDGLKDAEHLAGGQEVETLAYENRDEQLDILEGIVRNLKQEEGLSSSDILLMSPYRRENSVLGDRLAGYEVKPFDLEAPAEDTLYHTTILGFKGMDARAVILFDVARDHIASRKAHLYVGCSRARNLLYVVHEDGWTTGAESKND